MSGVPVLGVTLGHSITSWRSANRSRATGEQVRDPIFFEGGWSLRASSDRFSLARDRGLFATHKGGHHAQAT